MMRYALCLTVLLIVLVQLCASAPGKGNGEGKGSEGKGSQGKGKGKGKGKGHQLNDDDIKSMKDNCKSKKKNGCKGQEDKYKKKRKGVKDALLDELKNKKKGISDKDAENEVETRLEKIQTIKKKLNELNGLTDVDPADVGAYQGDMLLSSEQSDAVLQQLEAPGEVPETPNIRMKRSAAVHFESWPTYRWVSPIRYWISPKFSASERSTIDSALNTISTSVGCITFKKDTTQLTTGAQIQFVKTGLGCGGASPVGYFGINTIVLDTDSTWCTRDAIDDPLKGVVMHETIHSLGGGHEQSRSDRDQYVKILWSNIDSQEWDQYAMALYPTTSYGVKYDYKSIMHYQQGLFSAVPGLSTMQSLQSSSTFGSHTLSASDILQLKRMYCKASTCADTDPYCGNWAIGGLCSSSTYATWMKTNCGKSCGSC